MMKHLVSSLIAVVLSVTAITLVAMSKEPSILDSKQFQTAIHATTLRHQTNSLDAELSKAIDKFTESIAANPCKLSTASTPNLPGKKTCLTLAYENRGFAYFLKGDLERGIKDTTAAIELKPDYPDNYRNRAAAYKKLGKLSLAKQDLEKAMLVKPAYVNRSKGEIDAANPRFDSVFCIERNYYVDKKQFRIGNC